MLPIVVPVPTLRKSDGRIDQELTVRYAQLLAATWVRSVIVAGPAGLGERCTPDERGELAALWRENASGMDIVVGCWNPDDYQTVENLGLRPLAMLRSETPQELVRSIAELPTNAIAYANPRYSRALLTPTVVAAVAEQGALPSGIKLSKVTAGQISEIRSAAGRAVDIWHGSSRDIAASLEAGATAVVAPPLAALPTPWPQPSVDAVQRSVNEVQRALDAQPDHYARVQAVAALCRAQLTGQASPEQ